MIANKPPVEFRVKFIRGRSQNMLDSMLPVFANVVSEICPTEESGLTKALSQSLSRFFPMAEDKTLDNYSTEIVGKLFGMIVHKSEGLCEISPLTEKLIAESDQPAFFKVLASRLQFPNPMNRSRADFESDVREKLHIRPLVLVLEVMVELAGPASYLELRTFVLANKRALIGELSAQEIVAQIKNARQQKLELPDPDFPNRPFHHQHISEMLKLLQLANLLYLSSDGLYVLNTKESKSLEWVMKFESKNNLFRPLASSEDYRDYQREWSEWYGALPDADGAESVSTPLEALDISHQQSVSNPSQPKHSSTQELGRAGENIVLTWQLEKVRKLRPQDLKHVKDRSAERGIGFDIQSVWCDSVRDGQFHYLEVKTTKRSTRPAPDDSQLDLVTLTSNEYRAAQSHGANFSVCRVYLFPNGYDIYVINDPVKLSELGHVILEPADWNLYLTAKALDKPEVEG